MLLDADLFEAGGAACNTFGVKCVAVVVDAAEQLAAHKSKSTQGCYCCYDDNCGWCCTAPMRVLTACAVMLSHPFRSATVLRVASILEHVGSSFRLMPHTEPRCDSAEVVTCCVGGVAKTRLPFQQILRVQSARERLRRRAGLLRATAAGGLLRLRLRQVPGTSPARSLLGLATLHALAEEMAAVGVLAASVLVAAVVMVMSIRG
jgi:hypothetical protein